MSDRIPLTEQQTKSLHDLVAGVGYGGAPELAGRPNPHLRVFVAAFDGTNNDRDHLPKDECVSLVGEFQRNLQDTETLKSRYYEGVGTRTNWLNKGYEDVWGSGSLERAERAYKDFTEQVEKWRKEDPNIQVHVHVMSFSRGGGSALHFLNTVDKYGAEPPKSANLSLGDFSTPEPAAPQLPKALQGGNILSSATLIDTVVTGQHNILDLGLPKTTASALQITADLEIRRAFSFSDAHDSGRGSELARISGVPFNFDGRWNLVKDAEGVVQVFARDTAPDFSPTAIAAYQRISTLHLPGVHSDAGGTYKDGNDLRALSKFLVDRYHHDLGFSITPVPPTVGQINAAFAHDSIWDVDKAANFFVGHHERGHIEKKASGWDGTPEYLVELGRQGGWDISSDVGGKGEGFAFPEDGYRQHEARISLSPAGDFSFAQSGEKTLGYSAQLDRLTLYGQPIDYLGDKAHFTEVLANSDGVVQLAITPKKHIADYVLDPGPGRDVHRPAESKLSPEAALSDVLTNALPRLGLPAHELSRPELASLVRELGRAEEGETLLLRKNGEIALLHHTELLAAPARDGDVSIGVDHLSSAIGLERAHEQSQTSQKESKAVEAAQPAMER